MNYKISKRTFIDVPSASGVEWIAPFFWVVGDDSPFLFQMNEMGEITQKITLLEYPNLQNDRIPKSEKMDFEAITNFEYQNNLYLIILGSGAKEHRKIAYVVDLNDKSVQKYYPQNLYNTWQKHTGLAELNIEGICASNEAIFVFQRGNIGQNIVFEYTFEDFWNVLVHQENDAIFKTHILDIPNFNQVSAGISGSCLLSENEILFCASYEDTNNAIDDGEVLGSLLGIWNFKTKNIDSVILAEKNLKIESVCIKNLKNLTKKNIEKNIEIHAVTDADGGKSEMLLIELYIE
jgi:hypothetical protein